MSPYRLWIDGAAVEGQGSAIAVEDPATEQTFATVKAATIGQLDEAVSAARLAFGLGGWGDAAMRSQVLNRIADLLEARKAEIGDLLVQEVGTPVDLVEPLQIGTPIALFRYYAKLAAIDRDEALGPDGNAAAPSESLVRHVPVGVAAIITAYNYPLLLLALKLAPALAAGCTAVVLSSPLTPLSTLLIGPLMKEAGLPDGVVNLLVGGADLGQALTEHPSVDKVSFTGSVGVGSRVMQQAAKGLKGVTLELGGKNAMILMPGFDFAPVIGACHIRYLRNAGQGCASPTRIFVHRSQLDDFIAATRDYYVGVTVGDPRTPGTLVGPLINAAHRARVEGVIERAIAGGARIVAGGGRPEMATGWYMNPTLLTDVGNGDEISREELFAPVATVTPYDDLADAIAWANDSDLGLSAFVYGDREAALVVARQLRAGSVYVNGGGAIRMEAPMGGFKQSGIGREYGEYGIREYLEPQHIQWSLAM